MHARFLPPLLFVCAIYSSSGFWVKFYGITTCHLVLLITRLLAHGPFFSLSLSLITTTTTTTTIVLHVYPHPQFNENQGKKKAAGTSASPPYRRGQRPKKANGRVGEPALPVWERDRRRGERGAAQRSAGAHLPPPLAGWPLLQLCSGRLCPPALLTALPLLLSQARHQPADARVAA